MSIHMPPMVLKVTSTAVPTTPIDTRLLKKLPEDRRLTTLNLCKKLEAWMTPPPHKLSESAFSNLVLSCIGMKTAIDPIYFPLTQIISILIGMTLAVNENFIVL